MRTTYVTAFVFIQSQEVFAYSGSYCGYIILESKIVLKRANNPIESNVISRECNHAKRGDCIGNIVDVNQEK